VGTISCSAISWTSRREKSVLGYERVSTKQEKPAATLFVVARL
jgi:hypothetical protein